MGLDIVDFIMEVEEHFGIEFPDARLEEARTPGELTDLVLSILDPAEASKPVGCKSQRGFYKLRRALRLHFGVPRDKIRPEVPLVDLIGPITKTSWAKLDRTARLNYQVSNLCLSRSQKLVLVGCFLLVPIAYFMTQPFLLLFGLLLFFCLLLYFEAIKKTLPKAIMTVGDLVPFVNLAYRGPLDRDQVLADIIEIAAEQFGIKVEKITEHSRFVEDLYVE